MKDGYTKIINTPNLIGFFGFLYLIYPGIKKQFIDILNQVFTWQGLQGISAIAVAVTVIFIARQSKYLQYQTRPIAWFFLMSAETLVKHKNWKTDKNWLFVKNESKYTIFLYYKITKPRIDNGEKTLPCGSSWDNESSPLHVYPGLMQYPCVIPELTPDLIRNAKKLNKKIRIDIYSSIAPEYAEQERYSKSPETWRFDPASKMWEGPNGIQDVGFASMVTSVVNDKIL